MNTDFQIKSAMLLNIGMTSKHKIVARLIDANRNVFEVPTDMNTFAKLAAAGAKVFNEN